MDEIAETIIKALWNIIKFIIWEIAFCIIMFNVGRASLLIFTFGKYPTQAHLENDNTKISFFGMFVILATLFSIAIYNNANT